MKKTFFGISMGPVNMAEITPEGIVMNDKDTYLFSYLMRQLILEYLNVEAKMLAIIDEMELVGANGSHVEDSELLEERCVFSFGKEVYLSDILKTADLIVDDLVRKLIENTEASNKETLRQSLKKYFQPFCVEMTFEKNDSEEEIVNSMFSSLNHLEIEGRSITQSEQQTVSDFLHKDSTELAIGVLSL